MTCTTTVVKQWRQCDQCIPFCPTPTLAACHTPSPPPSTLDPPFQILPPHHAHRPTHLPQPHFHQTRCAFPTAYSTVPTVRTVAAAQACLPHRTHAFVYRFAHLRTLYRRWDRTTRGLPGLYRQHRMYGTRGYAATTGLRHISNITFYTVLLPRLSFHASQVGVAKTGA